MSNGSVAPADSQNVRSISLLLVASHVGHADASSLSRCLKGEAGLLTGKCRGRHVGDQILSWPEVWSVPGCSNHCYNVTRLAKFESATSSGSKLDYFTFIQRIPDSVQSQNQSLLPEM